MNVERQIFRLGDVPEVSFDVFPQPVECDLFDLYRDGAGLDLREVENVVDEVEQIGAGRIDIARELHLPVSEVAGNFSANCWLRIRMELSGVRNSWDMLARNSDLYLDVSASSMAFSSSACRACSTSEFLRSTSAFCSARSLALVPNSSLVCCSSLWRDCSSTVSCWDCVSRPFGTHRGLDGVEDRADALGQLVEKCEVAAD